MASSFLSIRALAPRLSKSRRPLLGIDVGTKSIGLAITDSSFALCRPLAAVDRRTPRDHPTPNFGTISACQKICTIAKQYKPEAVVVGYPLLMNNVQGEACQSVLSFIKDLRQFGPLEDDIVLVNERYSTLEALHRLSDGDEALFTKNSNLHLKHIFAKQKSGLADSASAALILERALEELKKEGLDLARDVLFNRSNNNHNNNSHSTIIKDSEEDW